MIKQEKTDAVSAIIERLKTKKNFILTHYSGTKVADLTSLRRKIREKGGDYKVIKNNLFRKALADMGYASIDDQLVGPIGVVFAGDQISELAKVLNDFSKDKDNFEYYLGVIENTVYNKASTKKLADLPSKEVLLSQLMSVINGPASHIARGTNQVMASLARGIKAVAEKNNIQ